MANSVEPSVVVSREIVEQLDHALAGAAHAAGDRRQLLLGRR